MFGKILKSDVKNTRPTSNRSAVKQAGYHFIHYYQNYYFPTRSSNTVFHKKEWKKYQSK